MYARDHAVIATPVGRVRLEAADGRIAALSIDVEDAEQAPGDGVLSDAARQLDAWFAGTRRDFDLPLVAAATPRGAALRHAIIDIGYGGRATYGSLAHAIGSSTRAIGQACARNPLPIIVPCHRVLPAGGKLGAYSGGRGPQTKQWLLDHEHRTSGGSGLWAR